MDEKGNFRYTPRAEVAQSIQGLARVWTLRGSSPGGGEIFRTCPDRPQDPPSFLYNGYRVFPGGRVKSGRDVTLTPHPLLVPLVMKEQSYTSNTPIGRTACTEPQCLFKGDLYLFYHEPNTDLKILRAEFEGVQTFGESGVPILL